jgi:hypothetical protein
VAAAITAYTALEALLKDRRHISKSIAADLTSSMHAVWAQEIRRRGLPETTVPLSSAPRRCSQLLMDEVRLLMIAIASRCRSVFHWHVSIFYTYKKYVHVMPARYRFSHICPRFKIAKKWRMLDISYCLQHMYFIDIK